jgi:hypothetical protein
MTKIRKNPKIFSRNRTRGKGPDFRAQYQLLQTHAKNSIRNVYKLNFGKVSTTNQTKPAQSTAKRMQICRCEVCDGDARQVRRVRRAGCICMRRYRRGELVAFACADTGAASWLQLHAQILCSYLPSARDGEVRCTREEIARAQIVAATSTLPSFKVSGAVRLARGMFCAVSAAFKVARRASRHTRSVVSREKGLLSPAWETVQACRARDLVSASLFLVNLQ